MRTGAWAVAAAVTLLVSTLAGAEARYVIAPGHEDLVADLLGRGEQIGPACRLVEVQMAKATIQGAYACDGLSSSAVVILRHPSAAGPPAAFTTLHFSVAPLGTVPEALLSALRARIVAREAPWQWAVGVEDPGAESVASRDTSHGTFWLPLAASCAAMLAVVAAAALRTRDRS
jgi:hypothetical protein